MKRFLFFLSVFVFFLTISMPLGNGPQIIPMGALISPIETSVVRRPHTFAEVILFLEEDNVNLNEYGPNYVCRHFALDLRENAIKKSFSCAFVLAIKKDECHALVAFDTIDEGIIFVEPQTDEVMWEGSLWSFFKYEEIILIW